MSLNWLQMSQFRVSSQTSCKYFQQKKTGFFFSLIDQIILCFFVFIFSWSHLLFCFLSSIWLNISNIFSFSLNLIRSFSFFFFSLSLNVIKLSLLFLPPIHKLGARESLRVSDAGSRGTEAANFETFHVFNFLMTKELGMENSYKETCYLVIWRLRMLDLISRLPSEIAGMHVWGLTFNTFDLE